jgi:hypothetical protein
MAVRYEAREQPCTGSGAVVSVQVVIPDAPRRSAEPQRRAVHDGDGTPADTNCARGGSDWVDEAGLRDRGRAD